MGSSSQLSPSQFNPFNIFVVYSDLERTISVSSIRIRNFPFIFLAYNQLNKAVLAVPKVDEDYSTGFHIYRQY